MCLVCSVFDILTSLNDCELSHLRNRIEFAWHVSHSTKTPSTSRASKCKIETLLKPVFIFICEVILCTLSLEKKLSCF